MSSFPPPAPHPGSAGRATASQEESAANSHPAEQTAPAPEQQREEHLQGYRMDPGAIPPSLELSPPSRNLDVRQRSFDPFIFGVAIGAIAAILGLLIGLYVFLLL